MHSDINYPVFSSQDVLSWFVVQSYQVEQSRHVKIVSPCGKSCHYMRHGYYIPGICYYLVSLLQHWLPLPCALVILTDPQPLTIPMCPVQNQTDRSQRSRIYHSTFSGLKSQTQRIPILTHVHHYPPQSLQVHFRLRWSSGQRSWLQIQRSRFQLLALPHFPRSSGSGTGSNQPREYN
jgi:hypothetical protein